MRNCLLAAVFVLCVASVGSAGPIAVDHYFTYHLEGVITASGMAFPQEGGDLLAELVPVGSPFSIDVVVDTSAQGDLYNGVYRYIDAVVGLVFDLNGFVYTMTSPHMTLEGPGSIYSATSFYSDLSAAAFSGPSTLGVVPDEFLFSGNAITQGGGLYLLLLGLAPRGNGDVHGTVTSVDVPEPSTILLMSSAFAIGLGSRLRKRPTI